MRKLHYILIAILAISCSQAPTDEASTDELVEVDFTLSGSISRSDTPDTAIPTTEDMQLSLIINTTTTGAVSISRDYTYNYDDKTFAKADGSTGLFVNNSTYYLRIAAPSTPIEKISDKIYYGYFIERSTTTPLYISDPITIYVDGIVITTGGTTYIHDLGDVTLHQQRSKVKVSFKCADGQESRTVKTLYYKDLYASGYCTTPFGSIFSDLETPESLYSFSEYPENSSSGVVYAENAEGTYTLATTTGEDTEQESTYFISADYSESGTTYPVLVVGLNNGDGPAREVDVPLNINMEINKLYSYDITISSSELQVNVSVADWDEEFTAEGSIDPVDKFTIDIDSGEIVWGSGGDDDASVDEPKEEEITQIVDFTDDSNSNCYILNPASDGRSRYYIPISRIDEFWNNATYVDDEYKRNAYKLSAVGDNWEPVMSWHDFSNPTTYVPINEVTIEKGTSPDTYEDCVVVTIPSSFADPDNHCNIGYVVRATAIDGNPVLWSWHLWITDYDPYTTTHTIDQETFQYNVAGGELHRYDNTYFQTDGVYETKLIMDRNLGARSPDFEGHGSMTSTTVTAPGTIYYQYGRKDPFPALYNVVNDYYYGTLAGQCTFAVGAQNPNSFITYSGNWCNEGNDFDYIWNDYKISKTNYTTGKSIFDPSPWGFRIPINGTWTGFTGNSSTNETNPANSYTFPWTNYFTEGAGDYGYGRLYKDFAYYPAPGYRYSTTGVLTNVGTYGNSRSATPNISAISSSYYLQLTNGAVGTSTSGNRALGLPVRPIQE